MSYDDWATTYLQRDTSLSNLEMIKTCIPRCDPSTCSQREKIFRRADEVAPRILAGVTLYLTSVPQNNRLPLDVPSLADKEAYFSYPKNNYPRREYLSEFNPSLVPIPTSQIPANFKEKGVVYLASFRVATHHACTSQFPTVKKAVRAKSYLGLALLRADLSIITDVVVDISDANRNYRMEDFRLFVLKGQIYVTSHTEMVPIWLVPPPKDDGSSRMDKVTKLEPALTQRNKVGNNNNSTIQVSMRTFSSCIMIQDGKNINYYHDESTDQIIAELYPMKAKVAVDPGAPCPCSRMEPLDLAKYVTPGQGAFGPNRDIDRWPNPKACNVSRPLETVRATPVPPFGSFGTLDQLQLAEKDMMENQLLTVQRGSACCVSIEHQGRDLWLGVLHSKTRFMRVGLPGGVKPNHFFSMFYAFEKQSPYAAVAWSGKFCLGFPSEEESHQNPYTGWNTNPLVFLGGNTLDDCPAIHFVSGMSQDAEDQSQVIIAYGVNDCTPRMVKVDKSEILRMLFPSSSPPPATTTQDAQKRIPTPTTSSNHSNRSNIHFDCTLQHSTSGEVLQQAKVDLKV